VKSDRSGKLTHRLRWQLTYTKTYGVLKYGSFILNLDTRRRSVATFPYGNESLVLTGSVDLRAGLHTVEKLEICCPCRKLNPDSSVAQPIGNLYTDQVIPAAFMTG
jgi:hypothetical protein